jgi:hypothetical protein
MRGCVSKVPDIDVRLGKLSEKLRIPAGLDALAYIPKETYLLI